jgi:C_GCAxxG_C_C family probable redox protein
MKDYAILSAEEKEALVKQAMDVAWHIEYDYGNCIQSVLCGLRESFPDIGITDDIIRASFGMAGGGCISLKGTCGALCGAAMAISLFYGRPADDLPGYYDDCHALIRTVMDAFEEKYSGVLCHEVLTRNLGAPYDWKTEEGFKEYNDHDGTPHDAEVVAFCTEMVARMLVDGKLQYGEDLRPDVENPYYKSPNTLKKIAAREERIRARKQQ